MKLALLALAPILAHAATPWNLKELARPPQVWEAQTTEPGVRALYYQSVPLQGKPTRVFAYYGAPAGRNLPAMVLLHGGGGTAFAEWVRMWNRRGYAAISMDTCGAVPEAAGEKKAWPPPKKHHEYGGPEGWGGFARIDDPVTDQWTYHAVAAAVLAHSLIRSFPEVDPKRTGVTGISWGGYLTSIVSGVDPRFRFAAPVYGCGFLGEDSGWLKTFAGMGRERAAKWLSLWDPSVYLPNAKAPMLWVNGTNDFAYPLPSHRKSYRLAKGPRTLAIRVAMKHSHPDGARPEEIFTFADSICKNGPPLPRITKSERERAEYRSKQPVVRAELNFTLDEGTWQDRKWKTVPARLDEKRHAAAAEVPAGARAWYFNLFDGKGQVVSSEYRDQ
ncbi:MAG: acetylxylan esterase [Acidobacteria bacterium]|nr:acetylxylan esterase [Acidobacteriota bacterium]